MTEALIALGIVALVADGIFVWQLSVAQRRLEESTRLFEGIVGRMIDGGSEDRKAHEAQISSLLVHIQAPKEAPFITNMSGDKQHIGMDDEEAWWENDREMNGSDD